MTHYPDLSPCTYFPHHEDRLLAVGWLEAPGFPTGIVDASILDKLCRILNAGWEPVALGGWHTCSICAEPSTGPERFSHRGQTFSVGIANLFVPSPTDLYVAPSLILHYIDIHHYLPHSQFIDAVAQCPDPQSQQYMEMIRSVAPPKLGQPPDGWEPQKEIRMAPRPKT